MTTTTTTTAVGNPARNDDGTLNGTESNAPAIMTKHVDDDDDDDDDDDEDDDGGQTKGFGGRGAIAAAHWLETSALL